MLRRAYIGPARGLPLAYAGRMGGGIGRTGGGYKKGPRIAAQADERKGPRNARPLLSCFVVRLAHAAR